MMKVIKKYRVTSWGKVEFYTESLKEAKARVKEDEGARYKAFYDIWEDGVFYTQEKTEGEAKAFVEGILHSRGNHSRMPIVTHKHLNAYNKGLDYEVSA